MSVSFNDGLEQARVFLRENKNRLTPNDWIIIAEQARQHFSRDKPQDLIGDLTGNGTGIYALTTLLTTTWANKFSSLVSVEYPANESDPVYVDRNDYMVYRPNNTTEQLKFKGLAPTASQTVRVKYTAPHNFSPTASTVDDMDKMLIALLLAAYAALALGADFLKANRSNLPNDSVDFSQKSKDMNDLAEALFKRYGTMLSGKTDGAKSYVTITKDFDMKTSFGEEFLIHDESTR